MTDFGVTETYLKAKSELRKWNSQSSFAISDIS